MNSRKSRWILAGLVLAQVGVYAALAMVLDLEGVANPEPAGAGWAMEGWRRWADGLPVVGAVRGSVGARGLLVGGILAAACALYGLGALALHRGWMTLRVRGVLGAVVIMGIPLLAQPFMLSADVHNYAMYGRIAAVYRGNPFVNLPADYPADPILMLARWPTTASVYGPMWIGVSMPLTWAAEMLGGAAWAYVLVYKLAAMGFHLASIAVVAAILRKVRPGWEAWGAMLYGWHPLTLIEFVGSGHNDALMVLLILLGVLMDVRGRRGMALGMLVCAGMMKLTALMIVPAYALHVARGVRPVGRWMWVMGRQVMMGAALVVAMYGPWWQGGRALESLASAPPLRVLHGSPAARVCKVVVQRCCGSIEGEEAERCRERVVGRVKAGFMLCFVAAWVGLTLYPLRGANEWTTRGMWMFVAYLLLGAFQFWPWYGSWALALGAVTRRPRGLLWAAGAALLMSYIPTEATTVRNVVVFGPMAGLVVGEVVRVLGARKRGHTIGVGF